MQRPHPPTSYHIIDLPTPERRAVAGQPIASEAEQPRAAAEQHDSASVARRDLMTRELIEAALRSSEERFRQIAEHIDEVFWLATPAFDQVVYVSPAYEAIWGRSCTELYDHPSGMFDAVHPDDRDRVRAAHLRSSQGGCQEEFRIVRPDGEIRWIRTEVVPVHNDQGSAYRVVGVSADITERRQSERLLRESEQAIRALYDIAAAQHVSFELRVEALLEMGCQRFGLPIGLLSRIEGEHMHIIAARSPDGAIQRGDSFALAEMYCSATIQNAAPLAIGRAGASQWREHRCYQAFGLETYLGTPIVVHDQLYGTLCFSSYVSRDADFSETDIDVLRLMAQWFCGELERRHAEAELEQQYREAERARSESRAVLDATNEGMVLVSPSGQFITLNRRFAELFGLQTEDVVGRSFRDVTDVVQRVFADPERFLASFGRSALDATNQLAETFAQKHPEHRELALLSTPVHSARGDHLGRLYAFRDVTHEREVERMKDAKSRELETELSNAARIQADLLPHTLPALPGFELAAECVPAREVGGDFYDYHSPAPHLASLWLCDVMGKGMPAALFMATVRAVMRAVVRDSPPAAALHYVSGALDADFARTDRFVTMFLAQLDSTTRRIRYVDAGHGHVFVRRADGSVELPGSRGLPLGVLPGTCYQEGELTLDPGDALVIYSDGLVDARPDLALDPYAIARYLDGATSALAMVDRLVALLGPVEAPPDDLTLLVLRCTDRG